LRKGATTTRGATAIDAEPPRRTAPYAVRSDRIQNHDGYVAEIKGRGIAAFHADNGSDAERLVRDRVFRDDFMVLATGGLPLWDGVTDIEVRLARPDEEVKWRASRAKAIRQGISRKTMSDGSLSSLHSPTDEAMINLTGRLTVRWRRAAESRFSLCSVRYSESVHLLKTSSIRGILVISGPIAPGIIKFS
jgi:hypothetical protein